MAIIKWDPVADLRTLSERLDKVLEDMPAAESKALLEGAWSPRVDIQETDKNLVITAELPGIEEKDIDVEVTGDTLVLKGKREFEKETRKENYQRIERSYGSFYRAFTLPGYVDADKIQAVHDKGLLKITLPKKPGVTRKRVKILPSAPAKK